MADPDPRADGATPPGADANAPEFSLQSVYLKDCSFEAPKGPRIEGPWNPQIGLDLNTASEAVSPELREVVLTVSITAKLGEATAFLVEVKQAGLFGVRNLDEEEHRRAIAAIAPSVLFPYARATIANLVSQGGFPQLLLPPVNFDALYARSVAEAAAKQQAQIPPSNLNS
ncbi:MAG: protein-export chaperone SecB [Gammaproteobacteria bacterium]|nr:protein-export chaperone SecB [Gammaproteobacteria bacterium]